MKKSKDKKNTTKGWSLYLVALIMAGALIWAFKGRSSESVSGNPEVSAELLAKLDHTENTEAGISEHSHTGAEKPTLLDIVQQRRTWNPGWSNWYGKSAPDIAFQDIDGKTHKLSDYSGKNLLLVFWATWCAPCHAEIPHLIELRKKYSKDELQIVGISSENPITVKRFAENQKLNYIVGTLVQRPPEPFASVRSIPSAFYIDKQGKIKLGTEGFVSKEESEAIIRAEH
jgi:thiol-disulfide isomerase/thioredoxin